MSRATHSKYWKVILLLHRVSPSVMSLFARLAKWGSIRPISLRTVIWKHFFLTRTLFIDRKICRNVLKPYSRALRSISWTSPIHILDFSPTIRTASATTHVTRDRPWYAIRQQRHWTRTLMPLFPSRAAHWRESMSQYLYLPKSLSSASRHL